MAIDTLGANALASDSVTTAKIVNDAVTSAKIPAGAVVAADVADGSISTAKLADNAVTVGKLATSGTLPAFDGSALTGIENDIVHIKTQTGTNASSVDFLHGSNGVVLSGTTATTQVGIHGSADTFTGSYGNFYPEAGLIILNGDAFSASAAASSRDSRFEGGRSRGEGRKRRDAGGERRYPDGCDSGDVFDHELCHGGVGARPPQAL